METKLEISFFNRSNNFQQSNYANVENNNNHYEKRYSNCNKIDHMNQERRFSN